MEDSTQTNSTITPAVQPQETPTIVPITPVSPTATPVETAPVATESEAPSMPTTIPVTAKHVSTLSVIAIIFVLLAAGTGGYFASKYLKANLSESQSESIVIQDENMIENSLTIPPTTTDDQSKIPSTNETNATASDSEKVKRK